jgi:hypothetical protein
MPVSVLIASKKPYDKCQLHRRHFFSAARATAHKEAARDGETAAGTFTCERNHGKARCGDARMPRAAQFSAQTESRCWKAPGKARRFGIMLAQSPFIAPCL